MGGQCTEVQQVCCLTGDLQRVNKLGSLGFTDQVENAVELSFAPFHCVGPMPCLHLCLHLSGRWTDCVLGDQLSTAAPRERGNVAT